MQNSTPHIRKSQPVAGLSFCLLSQEQIVQSVMSLAPEDEALRLVVTTNVDHMVTMRRQPEFKHACEHAWLVTADGFPVVSLLKALNIATPGRITGADLFPAILASLSPVWHSPFFVCASEATADYLRCWLAGRGYTNPHQRVIVPEFGFEKDALRSNEILTQIQAVGTTHLFFGVGAPKSELWMQKHRAQLTGMYGFGFGAGLDFFAGTAKRAPQWIQLVNMEWAWRLFSNPRRLAKRYLVDSWSFLRIALTEYRLTAKESR